MSTTTIKPITKLADGKEIRPETVLANGQVGIDVLTEIRQ